MKINLYFELYFVSSKVLKEFESKEVVFKIEKVKKKKNKVKYVNVSKFWKRVRGKLKYKFKLKDKKYKRYKKYKKYKKRWKDKVRKKIKKLRSKVKDKGVKFEKLKKFKKM